MLYKVRKADKILSPRPTRPDPTLAPALVGGTIGPLLAVGIALVPQLVPQLVPNVLAAPALAGEPDG